MSRWNKNILLKGFELKGSKHVSSYQGWNNIENDLRGNKIGNPGEIDFGPS